MKRLWYQMTRRWHKPGDRGFYDVMYGLPYRPPAGKYDSPEHRAYVSGWKVALGEGWGEEWAPVDLPKRDERAT